MAAMTNADGSPVESQEWTPHPDPTRLTTEQLNQGLASLKEIVFTRLNAMDRALELSGETLRQHPIEWQKQLDHVTQLIGARIDSIDRAFAAADEKCAGEAARLVDHVKSLIETRLDGYDKAIELLQSINDRVPASIDTKIAALREIQEEKFSSIQTQFKERDVRTDQSSKDSKVAVDAALQAAKEAVGEQNKSSALAIAKSEASTVKQIDQMGLLITTQAKAVDDKFSDVKDRLTRIEGKDVGKVATEASQQTNEANRQGSNSNTIAIIAAVIAFIAIMALYLKH